MPNRDQQQSDLKILLATIKKASQCLNDIKASEKVQLLEAMANLITSHSSRILEANQLDIDNARANQLSPAMQDRLLLDKQRIDDIAKSLKSIAALTDPIGEITQQQTMDNGLLVKKQRIPLGVILMIYESRPNVTVDAAALALKSGNAIILKGGKEAIETNKVLVKLWKQSLIEQQLPVELISLVTDLSRASIIFMLKQNQLIDLVIPRGGESLIKTVVKHSRIPVIQHYKGLCHLYVDKYADLDKAQKLLINGKTSRPGVCNSIETLLVHHEIAEHFLPIVNALCLQHSIRVKADSTSMTFFTHAEKATTSDYATEHLSLTLNVKIVYDLQDAIEHLTLYGSNHTDVIVTENTQSANYFIKNVQSSVVMVNASSRFSDGGELGLGAEIGISTSKLHAFGPMGHMQLTTEKYVVIGEGQIRV